ncbi:VOC family protein [Actinopolymorpha pittospori]|uniref:Catechol 2,3-dioxygenase-like lactoylglutathione lyase family enzyme n=1 Tax=Actinopolymorpha pittospori TaxID=648752 RepID=A0A927N4N3_9ACTN|nr:VOC family protein [Actinopolymorpha pittospori]MBE1612606.1 catechol 2,3-dioxygenase-like lactoylglutathione lyase family enzyme [Actinopolymorpha pittospori]
MTVELNHTIVPARDPQASAQFLADILGLSVDPPVAHFTPVTLANQVSLDYDQLDDFEPHHYAFMVGEQEFDAALARIQHGGITHYGDPACQEIGQISQQHQRPQGHLLPRPRRTSHGNPHPGRRRVVRPMAADRGFAGGGITFRPAGHPLA